ncbi:MAG TPA: DUF362 domain-containing protein [Pyrinomonadaceae bacterium]|nr:DUF362 domain-containing protein [Pyrinomonadaceae bacterium]
MTRLTERRVVVDRDPSLDYPAAVPFDPHEAYPEYPFGADATSDKNPLYEAVRDVLNRVGLDHDRYGSGEWNPLGDLVHRDGTVVLKPNWVRHYHPLGYDLFGMITHPAVLRPLVDYAYKAVGPKGRIWIMDAPLYDTEFQTLSKICQLSEFEASLRSRGVPLTIADLRSLIVKMDRGVVVERIRQDTWPSEGVVFDLGNASELSELSPTLHHIFGSDYDRRTTTALHRRINGEQRHCYRISRRVLEADLVISVPKLKTHKKTGVTLNIKNMIGINTDKNYIPHFRVGSPAEGGDEYPDTQSLIRQARRRVVRGARETILGRMGQSGERMAHVFMTLLLAVRQKRAANGFAFNVDEVDVFYHTVQGDSYRHGDWWGNDTCWRSALDINKILLYGTVDGVLVDNPVRKYFSLIDGIVAGDETGPLAPTPRREGVLIAGFDPVSVDRVATQVMGFDPDLIRDQKRASKLPHYSLTNTDLPIRVISNNVDWQDQIKPGSSLNFRPHFAWVEYFQKAKV